jgi:hypothetical protein
MYRWVPPPAGVVRFAICTLIENGIRTTASPRNVNDIMRVRYRPMPVL